MHLAPVNFHREDLFNRLRRFHHRCCRTMCRITMAHTIRHRISSENLFKRLHIEPLETYYHRRILRWADHVSRMPTHEQGSKETSDWMGGQLPTYRLPPNDLGPNTKKSTYLQRPVI